MRLLIVCFFSAVLGLVPPALADSAERDVAGNRTKVVILGSGTPMPDPDRAGAGVAVVVDDQTYLVDSGAGIVRRAAAFSPKYGGNILALSPLNLHRVFLTHLHSDHTMGLIDLMLTPWHVGRTEPLRVFGPEGTKELVDNLLEAYRRDRDIRIYGAQPANNTGWRVITKEFREGGEIYADSLVRIEAIPTTHGSWPLAVGYKFTTPDRTVLISGDTSYSESILEAARGVDVLVHEVYGLEDFGLGVPLWQRNLDFWKDYMAKFHTSTRDLARLASEAQPGLLILYHEVIWGDDPDRNVREIKRHYDGKVVSSKDLDVF